jgi:hypothetical protein
MCKLDFSIKNCFLCKPQLFFINCLILLFSISAKAQFIPGQLPVNIKTFIAATVNLNKVKVFWTTEYEKNNAFFDIERSANGVDFSKVGKVPGVNHNGLLTDYVFYDNDPLKGLSFYRLKQVDIDSNFNYSPIIRVKSFGFENTTDIYPNPARNGFFKIELFNFSKGKVTVEVYSMEGRLLLQQQFSTNNIIITHQLPAGMYGVKIHGKEFIETKRLVID